MFVVKTTTLFQNPYQNGQFLATNTIVRTECQIAAKLRKRSWPGIDFLFKYSLGKQFEISI